MGKTELRSNKLREHERWKKEEDRSRERERERERGREGEDAPTQQQPTTKNAPGGTRTGFPIGRSCVAPPGRTNQAQKGKAQEQARDARK